MERALPPPFLNPLLLINVIQSFARDGLHKQCLKISQLSTIADEHSVFKKTE